MVGKIFERGPFSHVNHSFEDRGLFRGSINSRRRRRGQANVRPRFQHNFRSEMIATQHSSRRIQEHQVGGAVGEGKRRQRLQWQRKARLAEDCPPVALRKSQTKVPVAPNALRIPSTIQRAGSVESIR